MARYSLGFDVGSSSIKATLVDLDSAARVATVSAPSAEMPISAPRPDWAEQDPHMWWRYMVECTAMLQRSWNLREVASVGISYQMHGLVAAGRDGEPLRPAIIWCDSRAVPYGDRAYRDLGGDAAVLPHLLNSPGNFTCAKLAWVKDNEPEVYRQIHKVMLPGDWLAYRMTGEMITTESGLSEGIFWDFSRGAPAHFLLDYFGIDATVLPEARESFGDHGTVTAGAAAELGIPEGCPVAYRAGDQPNNALSLNVLEPGEVAATAGTSGVVYGIVDRPVWDPASRVNTFLHVNHTESTPRLGMLQILNGTGILNRWVKQNTLDAPAGHGDAVPYEVVNAIAADAPVGSEGLVFLPFGNGAERILRNAPFSASLQGLNFNVHTRAHVVRAAQEGIVCALNYGLEIMRSTGISVDTVRAGHANMFLSPLFRTAFATVTGATVELYNTDGSEGAARGGAWGARLYSSLAEAFSGLELRERIEPDSASLQEYQDTYRHWREVLERSLASVRGDSPAP